MHKKFLLATLVLSLLLAGCGTGQEKPSTPSGSADAAVSEPGPGTSEPASDAPEPVSAVASVHFGRSGTGGKEFAVITGMDRDGNAVWAYETDGYEMTELTRIEEIALGETAYYFNEGGTITALDRETGDVLWRNDEFGGASIHSVVADNGTLYLCGYYGPDFFAVDKNGTTLKQIASFDDDYFWADDIALESDADGNPVIFVTLCGGGPDGYSEDGYVFAVNPQTFVYTRR